MNNLQKTKIGISGNDRKKSEIILRAENNFFSFISLVAPSYHLAPCHEALTEWIQGITETNNKGIILLPRGHLKSTILQLYAVWRIVRNPGISIAYVSETMGVATIGLSFIKKVLESQLLNFYWPLVNVNPRSRERWTDKAICVDHPIRKEKQLRGNTVTAYGIDTKITGQHCDLLLPDDLVTIDNALTETGKEGVKQYFANLQSVLNAGGMIVMVGTLYAEDDLYSDILAEIKKGISRFKLYKKAVNETSIEGKVTFLWERNEETKLGFNKEVLEEIKKGYGKKINFFFSQYFNVCTSDTINIFKKEYFQYIDRSFVKIDYILKGTCVISGNRCTIYAACDFAYTLNKRSDYTAIVISAIDGYNNRYVLHIERFKVKNHSDTASRLASLYSLYPWLCLRLESNTYQQAAVDLIKEYNRRHGVIYRIDAYDPGSRGKKIEWIEGTLIPYYEGLYVYHIKGVLTDELEKELLTLHNTTTHDDIADALTMSFNIMKKPNIQSQVKTKQTLKVNKLFGGIIT